MDTAVARRNCNCVKEEDMVSRTFWSCSRLLLYWLIIATRIDSHITTSVMAKSCSIDHHNNPPFLDSPTMISWRNWFSPQSFEHTEAKD